MKILNIKAIIEAPVETKHYKDIRYLQGLNQDKTIQALDVFQYGRIVGIREERARRQGKPYEKAILIDGFSMDIFKMLHKASKGLSDEELDGFFDDIMGYVQNNMEESTQDTFIPILSGIKVLEKQQRKEALN